jgi:hypothetical protein
MVAVMILPVGEKRYDSPDLRHDKGDSKVIIPKEKVIIGPPVKVGGTKEETSWNKSR